MRTLTLIFIALAIVGALLGHTGGALVALLWAGVCYWARGAMAKVPTVQGCGVPAKHAIDTADTVVITEDIQEELKGCQ